VPTWRPDGGTGEPARPSEDHRHVDSAPQRAGLLQGGHGSGPTGARRGGTVPGSRYRAAGPGGQAL